MPQVRLCARAADRTFFTIAAQVASSSCAQLIRTASVPASMSCFASPGSTATSVDSVTMMRVARPVRLGPNSALVFASSSDCPCSKSGDPALGESERGAPSRRASR